MRALESRAGGTGGFQEGYRVIRGEGGSRMECDLMRLKLYKKLLKCSASRKIPQLQGPLTVPIILLLCKLPSSQASPQELERIKLNCQAEKTVIKFQYF